MTVPAEEAPANYVPAAAVPGVAQVFHLLALGFEVEAAQVDPGLTWVLHFKLEV